MCWLKAVATTSTRAQPKRRNGMSRVDLVVRPIRESDDGAIAGVIRSVMPEFGADGPGFAIHDAEVNAMFAAYQRPGCAYFVAERDGEVLGGAGVAPLDDGDPTICELRKMYVLSWGRGIGCGRALLERCLEIARTMGYRQMYLETLAGMRQAQALYQKTGFSEISRSMGNTGHFGCDRFFLIDLSAD